MANWLNQDIMGNANAVNDPGGLGVSAGTGVSGITWGDVIQAASRNSNRNRAMGITNGLGQQTQNQPNVYQIQQPAMIQKNQGNDTGDIGEIMQVLGAIYGVG